MATVYVCASKAKPDARESPNINNHCLTDTTGPPPRLPAAGTAPRRSAAALPCPRGSTAVVLVLGLLGLQVVVDASDWHGSRSRVRVSKHTYQLLVLPTVLLSLPRRRCHKRTCMCPEP